MSRRALLLALFSLAVGPAADARELWSSGEASVSFSGSVRGIGVVTSGTDADDFTNAAAANPVACGLADNFADCPAFRLVNDTDVYTGLVRVRMRIDARATPQLSAVVVWDQELFAGTLDTLGGAIGEGLEGDTLFRADWEPAGSRSDGVLFRQTLYRGYALFEGEDFDVSVGRQRIAWGVARLWNPIDRFNAIPPLSLQPDQSQGVDSLLLRWRFTGFTFVEAIAAPLRDAKDGSYAVRAHGVLWDTDYSVMAGVFERAVTVGFDLDRNIGDAAARIEVVYADPQRKVWPIGKPRRKKLDPFWQVVVSADNLFDVGSGLYVLVEHLYNGNALGFGRGLAGTFLGFFESTDTPPGDVPPGTPGPFVTTTSLARFGGSRVISFAENQTGLQAGYDLTPELRTDLIAIYDWNGTSAAFFPVVRWSPLDWLEVTFGAQLFVGKRRSQYGDAPPLGYVLAEAFF